MGPSNTRFGRKLVVTTVGVIAAVVICSATLLFLRPWPEHSVADAILSARDVIASARTEMRAGQILQPDGTPEQREWPQPTLRADRLLEEKPAMPDAETLPEAMAAATDDAPANNPPPSADEDLNTKKDAIS